MPAHAAVHRGPRLGLAHDGARDRDRGRRDRSRERGGWPSASLEAARAHIDQHVRKQAEQTRRKQKSAPPAASVSESSGEDQ